MDGSIVDPNQKALKVDLSLGRLGKSVTGRSPGPSVVSLNRLNNGTARVIPAFAGIQKVTYCRVITRTPH